MAQRKGTATGAAKGTATGKAKGAATGTARRAARGSAKKAAPKRAAKAASRAPPKSAARAPRAEAPEPEDTEPEDTEEEEPPAPSGGDWTQLADRAAAKWNQFVDRARPLVDKARPAAEKASEAGRKIAVDLSGGVEKAFEVVSEQARDYAAKGQHGRVRIKFRGKQLAELPVAVVAAAEVASLWWFGPLRLLLGHVVGKAVLEVEFVSNADTHVADGRTFLSDGEFEKALAEFDRALAMDRRCAGAYLGRGIALKLRGDKPGARTAFEKAEEVDPHGESGREARRHLDNLG